MENNKSYIFKIVCVVTSVLFLGWGSCAAAPALGAGSGAAALAGALAMALFAAGAAARLPLYAPQPWLYTDIIVSTVLGVLLLLSAVLSVTLCRAEPSAAAVIDYFRLTITIANAGLIIASAVITYVSVMRRWDAVQGPVTEPPRPPPPELEV